MSYRFRSFVLSGLFVGLAWASGSAFGPPAGPNATAGGPIDAVAAAPYVAVPLPPAMAGSAACVAVVLALRFSRHRRWVTLR